MSKKDNSRIPRSYMHNPEGGGYRKHTKVHENKLKKLEDKIVRNGKLTINDIRKLIELEKE